MHGEVLQRREHMVAVDVCSFPLQTAYSSYAHPTCEIRIFTVRFFRAAPSRIASDVDNRHQAFIRPA
jgi:hypothetical protein